MIAGMRCPTHGTIDDDDATVCPEGVVRTVDGKDEEGVCGEALVPEYPADETDEG
jgi:hypothetical protein